MRSPPVHENSRAEPTTLLVMRPLASALALALLLLAGCGDDDDGAADEAGGAGTEQVDTADVGGDADGDATTGGGGGEAADLGDFPIPAPPGATEITRTEAEGTVAVTLSVPVDSYDDIVAFYEDWTASEGGSFQRIDAEAGGVSWVGVASGDAPRSIVLSAPLEGDAETFLSLTASES